MIEYLYQGKIRTVGAIQSFFSQDKMKSFSLDIPALEQTIGYLTACIDNIQEIGTGVAQTGKNLLEAWEGNATQDFSANMDNWKKDYDVCLSNIVCFRDGLELEILPKAKEVNELALGLALTLGGTKGAEGRNIISMEPEGIEDRTFTIGKGNFYVYTVNNTLNKTTISIGAAQNVNINEIGFECAVETQLQEGAVKSTIGIKKSVNVRPGWETVPVEVPYMVTEFWYGAEYPTGWYTSPYSFDDTLENVGEFCKEHPVITGLTIAVVAGAAIYFTGGAVLVFAI